MAEPNLLPTAERYLFDPRFAAMVNLLRNEIRWGNFTAGELRAAIAHAELMVEVSRERLPSEYVASRGSVRLVACARCGALAPERGEGARCNVCGTSEAVFAIVDPDALPDPRKK